MKDAVVCVGLLKDCLRSASHEVRFEDGSFMLCNVCYRKYLDHGSVAVKVDKFMKPRQPTPGEKKIMLLIHSSIDDVFERVVVHSNADIEEITLNMLAAVFRTGLAPMKSGTREAFLHSALDHLKKNADAILETVR